MGSAASVVGIESNGEVEKIPKINTILLKKLPEAIEEAIYVHEKFPLIIDPTEQAGRFLKYQTGTFINFDDPIHSQKGNINKALVGALQYGRTLTLKFKTLQGLTESNVFEPKLLPKEVLSRSSFFTEEVWQSVLPAQPADADPITISSEFVFILCTVSEYVPPELFECMHVIKVVDKLREGGGGIGGGGGEGQEGGQSATGAAGEEDPMDQIAALFGAKEVIR
jgi:hypothetical protein